MQKLIRPSDEDRPVVHSEALPPDLAAHIRDILREELERHTAVRRLMSVKDLARTLGKSVRWCDTAVATGELPPPLWVGGTRRWHPDTVDAWLRAQVRRPSNGAA